MRLIDADALAKKWQDVLDEKANEKGSVAYVTFELFIARLKDEPTIDAVPVVRCKDCTYRDNACVRNGFLVCPASNMEITDMDFCSYGERRDAV